MKKTMKSCLLFTIITIITFMTLMIQSPVSLLSIIISSVLFLGSLTYTVICLIKELKLDISANTI